MENRPFVPVLGGRKGGTDSELGDMEAEAPGFSEYHVKVILDRKGIYTVWR